MTLARITNTKKGSNEDKTRAEGPDILKSILPSNHPRTLAGEEPWAQQGGTKDDPGKKQGWFRVEAIH